MDASSVSIKPRKPETPRAQAGEPATEIPLRNDEKKPGIVSPKPEAAAKDDRKQPEQADS